jgi:hypothetical protein
MGMKKRREQSGHRPYLIHTSGTGVLVDNAKGNYPNDKVGASRAHRNRRDILTDG